MVCEVKGTPCSVPNVATENRGRAVERIADAGAGISNTGVSAPASNDRVSITEAGSLLQSLERAVAAAPVADTQKMEATRLAIAEGSYQVDSRGTADKLLRLETSLYTGGNER